MQGLSAIVALVMAGIGFGSGGLLGALTGLVVSVGVGSGIAIARAEAGTGVARAIPWAGTSQRIGGVASALGCLVGALVGGWKFGWAWATGGYVIGALISVALGAALWSTRRGSPRRLGLPGAETETVLFTDRDWSAIDGELCRVARFVPVAAVVEGKVVALDETMPYAGVALECTRLPGPVTGLISNKLDFAMLWAAFEERGSVKGARLEVPHTLERETMDPLKKSRMVESGLAEGEEVLVVWTRHRYKPLIGAVPSVFLPKLIVMVCPAGAYELTTDEDSRPELGGEERFLASRPMATWIPNLMRA